MGPSTNLPHERGFSDTRAWKFGRKLNESGFSDEIGRQKLKNRPNIHARYPTLKKVAIIMGSDSDLPIIEKAIDILKDFSIPFEVHIYSAHRTPEKAIEFSKNAEKNGFGVIIAAAGMAAHLAGVIAANTILPVIGIPCKSQNLEGIDALLSTVQMPSGIPVATVAINGGVNAALLSIEILAVNDKELSKKLKEKRIKDSEAVIKKDIAINEKFK